MFFFSNIIKRRTRNFIVQTIENSKSKRNGGNGSEKGGEKEGVSREERK